MEDPDTVYWEIFVVVSNRKNYTNEFLLATKYCNSLPDPRGSLP